MEKSFLRLTKGPFWVFYRGSTRSRKAVRSAARTPELEARGGGLSLLSPLPGQPPRASQAAR